MVLNVMLYGVGVVVGLGGLFVLVALHRLRETMRRNGFAAW